MYFLYLKYLLATGSYIDYLLHTFRNDSIFGTNFPPPPKRSSKAFCGSSSRDKLRSTLYAKHKEHIRTKKEMLSQEHHPNCGAWGWKYHCVCFSLEKRLDRTEGDKWCQKHSYY